MTVCPGHAFLSHVTLAASCASRLAAVVTVSVCCATAAGAASLLPDEATCISGCETPQNLVLPGATDETEGPDAPLRLLPRFDQGPRFLGDITEDGQEIVGPRPAGPEDGEGATPQP